MFLPAFVGVLLIGVFCLTQSLDTIWPMVGIAYWASGAIACGMLLIVILVENLHLIKDKPLFENEPEVDIEVKKPVKRLTVVKGKDK